MDSGNSGSLQSSSGAEEECDSRAAVHHLSGFIPTQPHPPPPPFNHHLFDHNQINNPFFFAPSPQHQLLNLPSFSDHHFLPAGHTAPTIKPTEPLITSTNAPRNPKKRSRASRRAPTTVLTTDTNNFRAMVQEFTGIPAPPFTSSSSAFPRLATSFDLFGRPSAMIRSNPNNFDNLNQLSPYLLRPFPYKLQSSPSSTMQNTIVFPSNSLHQSFLNPKTTQNVVSSNGFGVIGQSHFHHDLHTTLQDLVSTAPTTVRNDDQMASGNWDGGGAADRHATGMKGAQGFIEPWITSD